MQKSPEFRVPETDNRCLREISSPSFLEPEAAQSLKQKKQQTLELSPDYFFNPLNSKNEFLSSKKEKEKEKEKEMGSPISSSSCKKSIFG